MMFSRSGNRAAREANLIFNQAGRNQVSAESLDLFQVENQDIKFGSLAHALRDRRCAFDKCRVFEIENSALFLAIGVWDIKDIKRRRTLSARPDQFPDARCERPEQDIERRSARLIIDYFQEIKKLRGFPGNRRSGYQTNQTNQTPPDAFGAARRRAMRSTGHAIERL